MSITKMVPRQLRADLNIIAPDGKPWMLVKGWEDWRFSWTKDFYEFWRFPNKGENGRPIDIRTPGGFSDVECRRIDPFGESDKSMWENLWAHIIFSRREMPEYRSISDRAKRARWISERATIKDAVRAWVKARFQRDVFPADVEISFENGRFEAGGPALNGIEPKLRISVAHANPVSVAAVGIGNVGIEVETILRWETGFQGDVLSPGERILVVGNDAVERDEWLTRAACAKKAAAKAMGRGEMNSNRLLIESVDHELGEFIVSGERPSAMNRVEKFAVSTIRDGDYIIALAVR
jgi:phosphopantetheinyl transferase